MPRTLKEYAGKIAGFHVFTDTPSEVMIGYSKGWRGVLHDIAWAGNPDRAPNMGGGLYEVTAIVVARWEYLGGLYLGRSKGENAACQYVSRFLPKYDVLSNLSGKPRDKSALRSDFFTLFRDRTLHQFTPSGVKKHSKDEVLGWSIGQGGPHLVVGDSIHVDVLALCDDLCDSMLNFAQYLDSSLEELEDRQPQLRWKRGMWLSFCPHEMDPQEWISLGVRDFGIPK